jgi:Uma2 family endonuclease
MMPMLPHIDLSAWYLDEDAEMGEGRLQRAIIDLLLGCLRDLAQERQWSDYVIDADQYIAWMPEDPNVRLAPDVYLLWNPPENPWVESWQTWRPDHPVPVFALEVVSSDWRKDYHLAQEKYDSLGVDELIIFDPAPATRPQHQGLPFQCFRRDGSGHLRRETADADGVWSVTFGAFIVAIETDGGPRLRLATSRQPMQLLPAPEERTAAQIQLERTEKEQERAAKEWERAQKEKERAEKEKERAEKEKERAEKERERAENERLLTLLQKHGIDPDTA